MKKRLIKIIICITILLLFAVLEWQFSKTQEIEVVDVAFLKEDIEIGQKLLMDQLLYKSMPVEFTTESMVLKEDAHLNFFIAENQSKGSILRNNMIQKMPHHKLTANERIITLKCSMVESNGWLSDDFDYVDLIMITPETSLILEDALIIKRFSEKESQTTSEYYAMVVTRIQALQYYEGLKNSQVYVSIKQKR